MPPSEKDLDESYRFEKKKEDGGDSAVIVTRWTIMVLYLIFVILIAFYIGALYFMRESTTDWISHHYYQDMIEMAFIPLGIGVISGILPIFKLYRISIVASVFAFLSVFALISSFFPALILAFFLAIIPIIAIVIAVLCHINRKKEGDNS